MRKDYMKVANANTISEIDFIEQHWTKIWENEGGVQTSFDRVFRQEHYKLMMPYLTQLKKESKILDGGCGVGDWVLALSSKGFEVTGIDISKKTISQLNNLFPDKKFFSRDIRKTGFQKNKFNAYFSWGVFEHFEEGPKPCIEEAHRILKPGGTLFITVPMDNLRHSIGGLKKYKSIKNDCFRFYQYRFTPSELAFELEMAGFDVEALHPIHKRQGVLRFLNLNLGLPYNWFFTRAVSALIAPLFPKMWVSHMVMAIAKKK